MDILSDQDTSEGELFAKCGIDEDYINAVAAKGFAREDLIFRARLIVKTLGYFIREFLEIKNSRLQSVLEAQLNKDREKAASRAHALTELQKMGIEYASLPEDYRTNCSPETIFIRARIIFDELGYVTHDLLRHSATKLPQVLKAYREAQKVVQTQQKIRHAAVKALAELGIDFNALPETKPIAPEKMLLNAKIAVALTGQNAATSDLYMSPANLINKLRRQLASSPKFKELREMKNGIQPAISPPNLEDGQVVFVHCMPHQSSEFAELHGRLVSVIFKNNGRFDDELVKRYQEKTGKPFLPQNVLMVRFVDEPNASPFIIPRSLIFNNEPSAHGEILQASEYLTERDGDVVKYVTGGAKRMAKNPTANEVQRTKPRVIVIAPDDDRYNAAHYFVRYRYVHKASAQKNTPRSSVLYLLPDFRQDGLPVVWELPEEIFLSDTPDAAVAGENASPSGDTHADSMTASNIRAAKGTHRILFDKALAQEVKKAFGDDLELKGNLVELSEVPVEVNFTDEEKGLLQRGRSVAAVFFEPRSGTYFCVERKFISRNN